MLKKHQGVDKGEECVTLPVAESRAISRSVLCGCDHRAKRNWSKGQMGVEILPCSICHVTHLWDCISLGATLS